MRECDASLATDCLEEAGAIGRRLVESAQWDGDRCTWEIVVNDPKNPWSRRPTRVIAGPTLYQGTAGIALFLSELAHAIGGDAEVRRTVKGALRHSAHGAEELGPAAFGLHVGRVGIAHALARHAVLTGDEWGVECAARVLSPLFGRETQDGALDVVGGAAGAIPVLLQLADVMDSPAATESARKLGVHLVRAAHRWPEGWGWGPRSSTTVRDLTGLAHGAAGCAAGLLELWCATGDHQFRYAAERGFDYEAEHFDPALGNWRDYRSSTWRAELSTPEGRETLRAALRNGAPVPRFEPSAMSAWCHGAPGIGLTRVRAHAVLGAPRYATEARLAVEITRAALRDWQGSYSLCHGVLGNCEVLLAAAAHFDDQACSEEVQGLVRQGLERFGRGKRWPSGASGMLPDPSLLVGDAGVGHFLLRLVNPQVPSVLLPIAPGGAAAASSDATMHLEDAMRESDVDQYFGRTRRAFARLGVRLDVPESAASPVLAASRSVDAVIAAEPVPDRAALLDDAARVERTFLAAAQRIPDGLDEMADELRRLSPDEIDWECAAFRVADSTSVVHCDRDWDTWLADSSIPSPPALSDAPVSIVVFRRHGAVRRRPVLPLAAATLVGIETLAGREGGVTVTELAEHLLADVPVDAASRRAFEVQLVAQVRHAYASGLIALVIQAGAGEHGETDHAASAGGGQASQAHRDDIDRGAAA